jgi:phage-related protein (TIGR01555 family)
MKNRFKRKAPKVEQPEAHAEKPSWIKGLRNKLLGSTKANEKEQPKIVLTLPALPDGVIPKNEDGSTLAMDSAGGYMQNYAGSLAFSQGFIGYPLLSDLAQVSEYRAVAETTAAEMIREWIEVKSVGSDDATDRIKVINDELDRHKVRDILRAAIQTDHFFGRSQIFIDIKGQEGTRANPLILNSATVKKGALRGFKNIEPMWTSPAAYNSTDPTAADFFAPRKWYVLGKEVDSSRLITIVMRPVPDLLKAAYNFGGISMTQLMRPYVERWLRTADAVSELIHSFSLTGIATDMSNILSGRDMDDLMARAQMFTTLRDNRGLMITDKSTEEFFQFNTPLSGLDALQAQSQEQMAAPSHTPLVKLLGITPTGLNANSEGEISVYYDHISSLQEAVLREPLDKIIQLIQLDQFGDVDKSITFDFVPLKQLNGTELAAVRKSDADCDAIYIEKGVVSGDEVRTRLAADPESGFTNLKTDNVPAFPDGENNEDLNDGETDITDGQGHND